MTLSRSKVIYLSDSSQAQRGGKHFKSMRLKQSLPRCSTKPSKCVKMNLRASAPARFLLPFVHTQVLDLPPKRLFTYQLPNSSGSGVRIVYWAADKTATWTMIVPIRS